MTRTVTAMFDGAVLRLDERVDLEPNTRVRVTIEVIDPLADEGLSFLDTAASLNLEGPSDWSEKIGHPADVSYLAES